MPSTAVLLERPRAVVTDAVRRAQAGDESAFEQLYREHAGRVYAVCLRLTANAVEARERTQDVFVRAWETLPSYRGESAFSTWLHRLAVNVVLMELRTAGRRDARFLAETDAPEGGGAARDSSPALRMDLEAAVAALPPGARQVLVLHDIEGYQHQEIAEMLGIAEGTSKAHLFRARRLLREALNR